MFLPDLLQQMWVQSSKILSTHLKLAFSKNFQSFDKKSNKKTQRKIQIKLILHLALSLEHKVFKLVKNKFNFSA